MFSPILKFESNNPPVVIPRVFKISRRVKGMSVTIICLDITELNKKEDYMNQ